MTPVQQIVLTLGIVLIVLTMIENWHTQLASVV